MQPLVDFPSHRRRPLASGADSRWKRLQHKQASHLSLMRWDFLQPHFLFSLHWKMSWQAFFSLEHVGFFFFSFNNGISVWFLRVMLYSALISDLCVSLVGFSLSVDGQWPAGAQRHCIRCLWGRDQIDPHNWLFPLRDKVRWAVFIKWCWAMLGR